MVFASSVELTRGVAGPAKVNTSDESAEAQMQVVVNTAIPAPIAVVRAYLSAFEDDSVNRLLLRDSGADVLPNGWAEGPSSNGVSVVYGEVEGSKWYTMKTTGMLNVSAAKAARIMMAADMVPKYDDMTKEVRMIEKLSDATEARLVSCKGIMFTSPRDFCVVSTYREEADGRFVIATRSVDHPAGQRSGYVRATSLISGYIITPHPTNPDMCELKVIAHMDLGGNLPVMVVRYLGLSAPIKMVEKVREVVQKA